MDNFAVEDVSSGDPESEKVYLRDGLSLSGKDVEELESAMTDLTRLDLTLAYSSEKLVNLHALSMHLLSWDADPDAMTTENDLISAEFLEKALVYDLLSGVLDSEVREVDSFMGTLQMEVVDARNKISSCSDSREPITMIEDKLHGFEESLKQAREQLLELKMQSAELQRRFSAFGHDNSKNNDAMESNMKVKAKNQMGDQQRSAIRTLEKSLAREIDLEKKLLEVRQREEDLKVKLHYTEQVTFHMEVASEVVWGRFLEAENSSTVLMGISKGLLGRLQLLQFHLNGSIKRENEANAKLQDCIEHLKTKDSALQKLESSFAEHVAKFSKVPALEEKVKLLEQQLQESELRLMNAMASCEASQQQLSEMELVVESLEESNSIAETRAETAEAKVTQLTDTNLELTEELNFLKGSGSDTEKKVSLLEKQLRESEIQLQHAKASSEASQEQQNMLYSAIWDMETLIEELKSKVAKAETKTDNVEEQCIVLSETNFELNKEIEFLRARTEYLEASLDKANSAKVSSAKEIDLRTKLIMDMVRQLAAERERIHKQLYSSKKENGIMMEKLQNMQKLASGNLDQNGTVDDKEILFSKSDSTNATCTETQEPVSSSKSFQVDEISEDASMSANEMEHSVSESNGNGTVLELETAKTAKGGGSITRIFLFMAILVAILSVSAMYLTDKTTWFPL